MSKNFVPRGHSIVSPFLIVESVEKELEFMKNVFGAEITEQVRQPDGNVVHAEARIGDSTIMIGRASADFPARPSMLYVYNENVDETFQRALKFGATAVSEPKDQFYGNREAEVRDAHGNTWWIAQHLQELSEEEIQQRAAQQKPKE